MEKSVRITVYQAAQCDPKKCTALKLGRHGLVRIVKHVRFLPKGAVVLNPFSEVGFSPADTDRIRNCGLAALDCSWEHAEKVLTSHVRGTSRCLPYLLAGNPTNFAKPTKLSTVEALAAALYIAGLKNQAVELLGKFKWGHTFVELNHERLDSYSQARNSTEIIEIQKRFMDSSA